MTSLSDIVLEGSAWLCLLNLFHEQTNTISNAADVEARDWMNFEIAFYVLLLGCNYISH